MAMQWSAYQQFSAKQPYLTQAQLHGLVDQKQVMMANDADTITVKKAAPATRAFDDARDTLYGTDNWTLIQALRRERDYPVRMAELDACIYRKTGFIKQTVTKTTSDDIMMGPDDGPYESTV
jgi:hypothetical protein